MLRKLSEIHKIAGPIAWEPNPGPQLDFVANNEFEVLYGGAAGGGKTDALLIAAVKDVKSQYMRSIIFRETFPEMKDLVRRSMELYPNLDGRYRESTREWFFPSGAIMEFGFVSKEKDKFKYSGRAFTFIGWDELTRWKNDTFYRFLMARLRASKTARNAKFGDKPQVTLRVRSTTNPGGDGHFWVKERFAIEDDGKANNFKTKQGIRRFIPAKISDNPYLAETDYEDVLDDLPEHLRKMLKDGRWDVTEGVMFTEWDRRIHVCEPFALPRTTKFWRGADDGYNAPACVLWFALYDHRLYIIAELYRNGLLAEDMAEIVKKRDRSIPVADDEETISKLDQPLTGIIDSASFADHGVRRLRGGSRGKVMNELDVRWTPSHKGANSREQGCAAVHELLRKKLPDGLPKLVVFSNCKNLIRTLPALPIDPLNMEDVDTDSEDHAYDALRYGLQGIPDSVKRRKLKGT
jgi:hypothetical protein